MKRKFTNLKSKGQSHQSTNFGILNMNTPMTKRSYQFVKRTILEVKSKRVSLWNHHKINKNIFWNQLKWMLFLKIQYKLKKSLRNLRRNKLLSLKRHQIKKLSIKSLLTNFLKINQFRIRQKWPRQRDWNQIKINKAKRLSTLQLIWNYSDRIFVLRKSSNVWSQIK